MSRRKLWIGAAAGMVVCCAIALLLVLADLPTSIRGAVMAASGDPAKQMPISEADVTVLGLPEDVEVRSDASGLFRIPLSWGFGVGQHIVIRVSHPDYQPVDLRYTGSDRLYVARLTPTAMARGVEVPIAQVVATYSVRTTSVTNVGSALKTFEAVNTGNRPCNGHKPCSPDGKWKAAIGTAEIDAGPDNEFHNVRVSCIAGPCPFTKIEDNVAQAPPSRVIKASALGWSDTATFLLEAEVYRRVDNDVLRKSYPIIFDRALTFTLPAGADDLSIQAEVRGTPIVFPLGPLLLLSWADCQLLVNKDQTKICRCELKDGYYFAGDVTAGHGS